MSFRWIEFGKESRLCYCNRDTVRINMDLFVKRFQPDQYDDWLVGKKRSLQHPSLPPQLPSSALTNTPPESPSAKRSRQDTPNCISPCSPELDVAPIFQKSDNITISQTAIKTKDTFHRSFNIDLLSDPPPWAANIPRGLWQWEMFDAKAERLFNFQRSLREPHCAVCQHFVPPSLTKMRATVPGRSRRVLKNICFTRSPSVKVRTPSSLSLEDSLFQCNNCLVTVHAFCYGIGIVQETCSKANWICRR